MSGGQGAWRDGAPALKGLRVSVFAALSSRACGLKGGVNWENEGASLNLAVVPPWKLAGGCSHMIPTHPGRWRAELAGIGVLNGGTVG